MAKEQNSQAEALVDIQKHLKKVAECEEKIEGVKKSLKQLRKELAKAELNLRERIRNADQLTMM
jgi:hypothetical protein